MRQSRDQQQIGMPAGSDLAHGQIHERAAVACGRGDVEDGLTPGEHRYRR
jgi:hypothetical protein